MNREAPLGVQLFIVGGLLCPPLVAAWLVWTLTGNPDYAWPACFVTAIWCIVQMMKLGDHMEKEAGRYRTKTDEAAEFLTEASKLSRLFDARENK